MSNATVARVAPRFPPVIWQKNRGYVLRSALDRYKAELQGAALRVAPVEPPSPDIDSLVPLRAVCHELGLGRRTIGRRVAEAARQGSKESA